MRAFIGIALPEEAQHSLARLQQELAASGADVKWAEPAHFHLTLKFLGEISEAQRDAVDDRLRRVAAETPSFVVRLQGLGAFPSLQSPRVIWVGMVEGQEPLTRLADTIEQEGKDLSLRAEERSFAAHLTLGRTRSPRGLALLVERLRTVSWIPPASWSVAAVLFYRSALSAAGPTYAVMGKYPLRAASGAANPVPPGRPAS